MILSLADCYVLAARCPATLVDQTFGEWRIEKRRIDAPFPVQTILRRVIDDEVVMEDGDVELRRHLPIWLKAAGRVLITGLGLGCVVRALLKRPEVSHIDVVEIDPEILRVVGPEFEGNPRITLHQGDALSIDWPAGTRWDYVWHDIWAPEGDDHLQVLHGRLLALYFDRAGCQGAWNFPREFRKMLKRRPLGARFL